MCRCANLNNLHENGIIPFENIKEIQITGFISLQSGELLDILKEKAALFTLFQH
ncbi:motility protein A [Listeria innocua FSL J1-023]|nr:motility protein A [Listeria innocua FSL J1-023]